MVELLNSEQKKKKKDVESVQKNSESSYRSDPLGVFVDDVTLEKDCKITSRHLKRPKPNTILENLICKS